jgi:phosphohistidine phosphatase
MARFLAGRGWMPDIIVASPSRRTMETVLLVSTAWPATPRVQTEPALYLAEPERIAASVQALSDATRSAMIVGHNPGLEVFAGALADRGSKPAREALNDGFPTCALAVIELDVERWTKLTAKSAQLTGLYVAKDIAREH